MPIFHDPDDGLPFEQAAAPSSWQIPHHAHEAGADRQRMQIDSSETQDPTQSRPLSPTSSSKPQYLGRVELIERLKRSNSPVWQQQQQQQQHGLAARPASRDRPRTPLRSPTSRKPSRPGTPEQFRDSFSAGLEIQRPRSALHSGDFREQRAEDQQTSRPTSPTPVVISSRAPWTQSLPAVALPTRSSASTRTPHGACFDRDQPVARARAISQSSLGSFMFMPPTSPLVRQLNSHDPDHSSRPSSRQASRSPERSHRRHTFSPHSLQGYRPVSTGRSASGVPMARHARRDAARPYQAHQPRRSLSSVNQVQPHSIPQTPYLTSRRPSITAEGSPLHHAPMVGSYEESILRGRMSTTPSRPLDFIAKLGVLGRGQCKSSLRCPPHVAIPFPAVFYSYDAGARIADGSPSPYVGLIDLENSLAPHSDLEVDRRKRRNTASQLEEGAFAFEPHVDEADTRRTQQDLLRRKEKKKRRSTSPKAPHGGSYRIPQQGQLQIVIQSPSKTAVKLFLVPYDLSDMEPGQKTFIRQRSYSAGPIIDMPLSSRTNFGTDRPEAALSNSDDPGERPVLRYLIHLHICCPSKGRYYLYKSIRVVFANRVPDDKEKLRNEIQLPEPRYSAYKPSREPMASQSSSVIATQLAKDRQNRRRSAANPFCQLSYDQIDGIASRPHPPLPPPAFAFTGEPPYSDDFSSPMRALNPIPFNLPRRSEFSDQYTFTDTMEVDSHPVSPIRTRAHIDSPTMSHNSDAWSPSSKPPTFEKLSREGTGQGDTLPMASPPPGAGLLARRFRELEVHHHEGTLQHDR